MKIFSDFKVGDIFHSTCTITEKELEKYLKFSTVKNASLEKGLIPGRAILSRMEGEFTRLEQIYGNDIIFLGTDGDSEWGYRNTRFFKPLYAGETLKLEFTVSQIKDIDNEFGKIFVDYKGILQDGEVVVISKKNIYRIKKH